MIAEARLQTMGSNIINFHSPKIIVAVLGANN